VVKFLFVLFKCTGSSSSLSSLSSPITPRSSRETEPSSTNSLSSSPVISLSTSSNPKIFSINQEKGCPSLIKFTGSGFSHDAFVVVDQQKMKTAHVGSNELWINLPPGFSNSRPSVIVFDKDWQSPELFFPYNDEKNRMHNLLSRIEKIEQTISNKPRREDPLTSSQASELTSKSLPDLKSLENRVNLLENRTKESAFPCLALPAPTKIRDITNQESDVPSIANFSTFQFFQPHQQTFSLPNITLNPPINPSALNFLSRKRTLPGHGDLANLLTKFSKN